MSNEVNKIAGRVCEKCGRGEGEVGVISEVLVSFSTKQKRRLCEGCMRRGVRMVWWWVAGIFAALLSYVAIAERIDGSGNRGAEKFAGIMAVWAASTWVMLLLHEMSHAVAALGMGMTVQGISLGRGRLLRRFTFGKIFLDVHWIPTTGMCWTGFPARWGRLRYAIMILAGPAFHAAMVSLILWCGLAGSFSSIVERRPRSIAQEVWVILLLVNLGMLYLNMLPFTAQWNGRKVRSDGGQLWDLLKGAWQIEVIMPRRWRSKQAEKLIQWHRDSVGRLTQLGSEGKWEEVQREGRDFLWKVGKKDLAGLWLIGWWVALADVWMGGDKDLREAQELSKRCLEIAPHHAANKVLRACVFMAIAQDGRAEQLLDKVPERDGAIGNAWQALRCHLRAELCRRKGKKEEVVEWEGRAASADPKRVYRIPWETMRIVTID